MGDPRSGIMPAQGLDKCELTEGVHIRSAFHGISQRVLGALKTSEVQHEMFRSWGSYQLMAVIFHPILQAEHGAHGYHRLCSPGKRQRLTTANWSSKSRLWNGQEYQLEAIVLF